MPARSPSRCSPICAIKDLPFLDALGLGVETENCALLGGDPCPLDLAVRAGCADLPAMMREITAVPEIAVQVDWLVGQLANPEAQRLSTGDFLDLGAGI